MVNVVLLKKQNWSAATWKNNVASGDNVLESQNELAVKQENPNHVFQTLKSAQTSPSAVLF